MKKFISGLLVGALICTMLGTLAAVTYVAEPASFKVLVNGKEFISHPPALVVEGRTYLPLRAMGDALGVPVNWNSELNQAEVGKTSTSAIQTISYSRTNPAPLNTIQTYVKNEKYIENNYSANIRIMQVMRGAQAWAYIKNSNQFNDEPAPGYEYIVAKVAFSLLSVQNDSAIAASKYDFDFYSGNNEEYEFTSVVLDNQLSTNLFAGGNAEGYIACQVKKDDVSPKVVYGLDYDGTGGVWFKLQ